MPIRRLRIPLVPWPSSLKPAKSATSAFQRPPPETIRRALDDWRRGMPRFERENFRRNIKLVERIRTFAVRKGCTPAQFVLAWVLAQGDDSFPFPGRNAANI